LPGEIDRAKTDSAGLLGLAEQIRSEAEPWLAAKIARGGDRHCREITCNSFDDHVERDVAAADVFGDKKCNLVDTGATAGATACDDLSFFVADEYFDAVRQRARKRSARLIALDCAQARTPDNPRLAGIGRV